MTASKKTALACDLQAFSKQDRARYQHLRARMKAGLQAVEECKDGYAFHYPASREWGLLLAEFMMLEHLCCPFFSFNLGLASGGPSLRLDITGDAQVKAFLSEQLKLERS